VANLEVDCEEMNVGNNARLNYLFPMYNVYVIASITRYNVNMVDTEARVVYLHGHPAKY